MLPTPAELREQSRLCREAAKAAVIAETRHQLARYALALAQVAEALERDGQLADVTQRAKSQSYKRLLALALSADTAEIIRSLLGERPRGPFSSEQIRHWRMRAEEMRTTADHFTVPLAQDSLRRAADNYEKMADQAEALLAGRPPAPEGKAG